MKGLIDILDFSVEEIDELISVACDIIDNPKKYSEKCKGLDSVLSAYIVDSVPQIRIEKSRCFYMLRCSCSRPGRYLLRYFQTFRSSKRFVGKFSCQT